MPGRYANTTVNDIYSSLIVRAKSENHTAAECWIEAENIFAFRALVCEWFQAMQKDVANSRFPDLECRVSQDEADHFIEELEADFMDEFRRFESLGRDTGPGFNTRLLPHAKVALVCELKKIILSEEQIKKISEERIKTEDLPVFVRADAKKLEIIDFGSFMG